MAVKDVADCCPERRLRGRRLQFGDGILELGKTLSSTIKREVRHRTQTISPALGIGADVRQDAIDDRKREIDMQALGLSSAYVLLSWVYDAFNELPYLRFRGGDERLPCRDGQPLKELIEHRKSVLVGCSGESNPRQE